MYLLYRLTIDPTFLRRQFMDFSIVLGKELDIKLLSPQLALRVAIGLHLGEGQHEGVNPILEVVCEVLHCVSQSAARAIINVLPCAA